MSLNLEVIEVDESTARTLSVIANSGLTIYLSCPYTTRQAPWGTHLLLFL